ncbi:6-phosphogluconolactonase [Slackia heliotrinireducens]|uniref:6-phosphogluconolactonase n=1 Tax=Slackia heliotrinireducens TaxID=84110 RepID=UPI003314A51D
MQIIVTKDAEETREAVADAITDQIAENPGSVLALSAAPEALAVYDVLADRYESEVLDFSRLAVFNLGEYCGVQATDPDSVYTAMRRHLYDHVNMNPEHAYVPEGMNDDADAVCDGYEARIHLEGGIDLIALPLGSAGELGLNVGGSEFSKETQLVDDPRSAYTMGVGTIMEANQVVVFANGSDMAEIVRDAFFGPVTPTVPASILQFHPDATAIVDEAAFECCFELVEGDDHDCDCGCDDDECCHGEHHHNGECCGKHHH